MSVPVPSPISIWPLNRARPLDGSHLETQRDGRSTSSAKCKKAETDLEGARAFQHQSQIWERCDPYVNMHILCQGIWTRRPEGELGSYSIPSGTQQGYSGQETGPHDLTGLSIFWCLWFTTVGAGFFPPCLLREMRIACLVHCYLLLAWWLGLNWRNSTRTHNTHTLHTHTSHTHISTHGTTPRHTCVSPHASHTTATILSSPGGVQAPPEAITFLS